MGTGYEVGGVVKGKTAPAAAGQGDLFVDQTTNRVYLHNGIRFFEITAPVFDVRAFGARGDGTGDDGPAINAAIVAAQAVNGTVVLGARHRVTTQIVIAGANHGIALVGIPTTTGMQQGSTSPVCVLEWAGGATPAIAVSVTYCSFANFSIFNTGSGTAAMSFAANGRAEIHRVSFAAPNGATAWSTSAIDSAAGLNYSKIDFCDFEVSPAIKMSGVHTLLAVESCLFDATGAAPTILATDLAGDAVHFRYCTFNSQSAAPTFWDNSSTTTTLNNLTIESCEFDGSGGAFQSYVAKVKNVHNFVFRDNSVEQFGNAANTASLIQLTNVSRTYVEGNTLSSVNPPLVKCNDSDCRTYPGPNRLNTANTAGLIDATGAAAGNIVNLDSSTGPVTNVVRLHGELVDPQGVAVYVVTVPNNTNFEVQIPGPTSAEANYATDPGWMAPGQVFWVRIRNAVGAAMGTVSFRSEFKTAGAFTAPASGKHRSICFYYRGDVAYELVRTAADVDN